MPADSSIDWASAPGSFPNVAPMSFQLIGIEVWDCKHGTGPGSQRGSGHVQARGIGTLGLAQTGGAQESGAAMWLRGAPQTEGQTRCVHMEMGNRATWLACVPVRIIAELRVYFQPRTKRLGKPAR